jgi:hypothetical protein
MGQDGDDMFLRNVGLSQNYVGFTGQKAAFFMKTDLRKNVA